MPPVFFGIHPVSSRYACISEYLPGNGQQAAMR